MWICSYKYVLLSTGGGGGVKRYGKSGADPWIYVGETLGCIGERMGTVLSESVGSPSEAPSWELRIKIWGAYDPDD